MDETNQTQKEVGQKYRRNLSYFKKTPFLAREKFYLCVLMVLLGIYAIVKLEISHTDKVYNPAPLSVSHAYLESNCAACHNLAARNLFSSPAAGNGAGQPVFFASAISINQACQKCHAGMDLHQPTSETLAMKDFHTELHIVPATGCFSCHQEHLGRIDLKLPTDSACAACHNNAGRMAASFIRLQLSGSSSRIGFDGVTTDGVIHFIPPERKQPLPMFASFERGHPPFEYEQPGLKDPDVLKFSHHQHLAPGMKLSCADCHKPSADGIYYRQVTYEAACERCHTLQFDPANPQLLIPHGNVARLSSYLHSLTYQYGELDQRMEAEQHKIATPAGEKAFAVQQIVALLQKAHVQSPGDLEEEILFTADPYKDQPPTRQKPFFSGCAYCHQVTQGAGGGDAVVTPPQMADRWLAHGRFTHASHLSMSCVQCHDANGSREASDIIMPSQASCVTCHRTNGGAPSNCLACHTFHSPQSVVKALKGKLSIPPVAGCPAAGPTSSFLISEEHPKP